MKNVTDVTFLSLYKQLYK